MYIGLIGSTFLCKKGRTASLAVPDVSVLSLVYECVSESPALVEANQSKVDAFFFLGLAPYLFALNAVPRTIPWFCVGMPASGILAALLQARQHLNGPARFSIDSITQKDIYEILDETDLDVREVHTFAYKPTLDHEKDLVSFHTRCYEEGKVDFCLTWLLTGQKKLKSQNIPAYYISPTVQSIRDALIQAVTQISAQKGESLKTVVGFYRIENADSLEEKQQDEIHDFIAFHALKKNVLLLNKSSSTFQSIESYGQFLASTRNFTCTPFKDAILKAFPELKIKVGYGLAPVISTAEERALMALETATRTSVFECVLFDGQDYRKMGELDSSFQLTEELRRTAKKMRFTEATFLRYLQVLRSLDSPFSAKDFAQVAGVQPQVSRKIFLSLLRGKLIEETGKRSAVSQGRPANLYRLLDLVQEGGRDRQTALQI